MIKFIKKWFFPQSFSFMFYSCVIGLWFLAVPGWNRSWETFQNYFIFLVASFSIFYLAMDAEDGRFTNFHAWHKSLGKWMRRLVLAAILILWLVIMSIANHYFPFNS